MKGDTEEGGVFDSRLLNKGFVSYCVAYVMGSKAFSCLWSAFAIHSAGFR